MNISLNLFSELMDESSHNLSLKHCPCRIYSGRDNLASSVPQFTAKICNAYVKSVKKTSHGDACTGKGSGEAVDILASKINEKVFKRLE